MQKALTGKEEYLVQAIADQFRSYITDLTFTGYDKEGEFALFKATNQVVDMPCFLKSDGKQLWLLLEDDEESHWVDMGVFELNSYIPRNTKAVFVDHHEAINVVKSYRFQKEDLEDLLGIMYSRISITEEQLKEELNAAQSVFEMAQKS